MKTQKRIKRKLKFRNIFLCFFLLLLCCGFGFYLFHLPIRNIIIEGTSLITDQEIISVAGIKEYPSIFRTSTRELKDKIKSLSFVLDVQIKKSITGVLRIQITEDEPCFYNRTKERLILLSGSEIESQELQGVPILVNYVPDELYQRLLKEMKETNSDVLKLISEIEYQPWRSEDIIIDDTRFFLRMNDGNVVYVNLINWDKLNNYMTIYSTLGDAKGTLQLDSSLGNGITFTPFS